jgi:hypothetical protein
VVAGVALVGSPGSVNSEGIYRGSLLEACKVTIQPWERSCYDPVWASPENGSVCKTFQGSGCWTALSRERATQAVHSTINLP